MASEVLNWETSQFEKELFTNGFGSQGAAKNTNDIFKVC
jgi:hypothetical protein